MTQLLILLIPMTLMANVAFAERGIGVTKLSKSFNTFAIEVNSSNINCLSNEGQIVLNQSSFPARLEYIETDIVEIDREVVRKKLRSIRKDSMILDDITFIFPVQAEKPIKPLSFPMALGDCIKLKKLLVEMPKFNPFLSLNEKTTIYLGSRGEQRCIVQAGNNLEVSMDLYIPSVGSDFKFESKKFTTREGFKEISINENCNQLLDINNKAALSPVRDFIKRTTNFKTW